MGYIYLIISLAIIVYMTTRKIDLLGIGAVCFIIYHFHAIYGEVYIHSRERMGYLLYFDNISNTLYVILFLQLILLLLTMIIYDLNKKRKSFSSPSYSNSRRNTSPKAIHKSFVILGFISMFVYAIDIFQVGLDNLSGDKSAVWEQVGIFYVFSLWSAMAVFAYAIRNKKYTLLLISVPQVLIHLYIGSRAYFAVLIIVILIYYGSKMKENLIKNIKIYILGAIGAFGIHIYKTVWEDIKIFDFAAAINTLITKETYLWAMRLGEPRIVLANYNYVINSNFSLDYSDIVARFISVIPFANGLVNPTNGLLLSGAIRNNLQSSYGIANNFWAEGYAMFGYAGIYALFVIWIFMLIKGNKLIESNKWTSYFLVPLMAYLAFYIHRMDFTKVIGNIKYMIFAAFIWWLINSFITKNWTISFKKMRT